MIRDAFGLASSSASSLATTAFEEAVRGLAAHKPNTGIALGRALEADVQHVPSLVLKGFANLILAREELLPAADDCARQAGAALAARDGGTQEERCLVEALGQAVSGSFARSAQTLDDGFADRPTTFLPFKIAYSLRFMIGDLEGMLRMSDRMMDSWSVDTPAAGYLLGCRAFALEESGQFAAAERTGRRAVALAPDDAWGMHAVSHVHEMRGDCETGIGWLEQCRPAWSRCNNFSFHMAWHLALLHLARGEHDRVLTLYDTDVRPAPTDDVRDVANAASLLWRLSSLGVSTGSRWEDLREIAKRRQQDVTLVFGALHTLLTLIALRDRDGIVSMIGALEARAAGQGDQARAAATVGLPLARLLAEGDAEHWEDLDPLLSALSRIGGSIAQRDVFLLALADAAARRGDVSAVAKVAITRGGLKSEDRLIRNIEARARMATARPRSSRVFPGRILQGLPISRSSRSASLRPALRAEAEARTTHAPFARGA